MELTELCAVSVRDRVRSRVCLGGWMSIPHPVRAGRPAPTGSVGLRIDVAEVMLEEDGRNDWVTVEDYRRGEPDPLHLGAAEQLQHLVAHHPDAIDTLSRLCEPAAMLGVVRVLPVALDRYGIVLRVEKLREHCDVRLPFRRRVDTGTEAAAELRHLLAEGGRRRPCAR